MLGNLESFSKFTTAANGNTSKWTVLEGSVFERLHFQSAMRKSSEIASQVLVNTHGSKASLWQRLLQIRLLGVVVFTNQTTKDCSRARQTTQCYSGHSCSHLTGAGFGPPGRPVLDTFRIEKCGTSKSKRDMKKKEGYRTWAKKKNIHQEIAK